VTEPEQNLPRSDADSTLLREAFEKFIVTGQMMEKAYLALQEKVEQLNLELEKKNDELSLQLAATELARDQLSDVLGSLQVAVVVFDGDGRVARLNRAAETLFGCAESAMLGRGMDALFAVRFAGMDGLHRLLATGQLVPETEVGQLNGLHSCVLRVSTHLMRGMDGAGEGRILLAEDITDLALRRRDAARSDRLTAMGEMAVQIVHEIRNPMGSIELFASMLQRDLADQPQHAELAKKVQEGIRGLNHVIGNLLSFAKGAHPVRDLVDLEELFHGALSDLEHQIERQQIKVTERFDADARFIRLDAELWRQVLLNMILNAVQAMPAGGELAVCCDREMIDGRPGAKLVIADTGEGMSADVRDRIFHPFFTTKDRGTGLGLALVHNIVKAHGGAIGVETAPGRGATFTITLPG
jgi:PAS domain S-box-containing protein